MNAHIYRTIRRLTDDIDNRIRLAGWRCSNPIDIYMRIADLCDAILTIVELGVRSAGLHYVEYNADLMARTICRVCHENSTILAALRERMSTVSSGA